MGRGWRHAYQTRLIGGSLYLVGSNAYIGMLTSSGSIETWKRQSGGTFTTVHKEYRGELREVEFGDYIEWTTPERIIHKFYHPTNWPDSLVAGKLTHIRDFNGNTQSFTYDEFSGRLSTITDTAGGTWTFGYDNAGLLTSVNGPTANPAAKWTVTFTYTTITVAGQPQTVLATKSIAGPAPYSPVASMQWQFFYNGQGLLERIVDPRGLNDTRIAYDTYGRKTSEMDALGRSTQFEYNKPALRQLTTTELHGSNSALNRPVVDTFDRKLRLLSRLDPLGFTTSYEYDPVSGDVLTTTDARGIRSAMTYDGRSNITSRINGLGEKTEWTYAQTTDPPGSTNGHLVGATLLNKPLKDTRAATAEASAGWENRYEYDSAGNLRFHRDGPVGGANFGTLAEHAYDARGLVISSKDANGNEARFAYDPTTGFLSSRTTAFGTAQAATWNITVRTELGWPITETNPLNEPGLSG